MTLLDALPTDSVLRRHALTERERQLGWPPTDSVLRRHHAQWRAMLASQGATPAAASPSPAATVAAPAVVARATPAAAAAAAPVNTPAPAGGLWGWLKRLLGG